MDDILTTGQQWAEAESRGDTGTLATLITDDFHVVGPVGFVLDRQQYLGRYQGGFTPEAVSWDEVEIGDHGDAAVTVGAVTQQASFQGQRADGRFRVSHVFVREDGGWKIAHVHYSTIGGPPPFAR
jgi:ketosteroid isomerase-like protein